MEITEEDKINLFVIVDDENRNMFLKRNDDDELETGEGLESAEFFTSEDVKDFLTDNGLGWYVMTFGEALEQEGENDFEINDKINN